MLKKLPGTRALQLAGSLLLCAFTITAQAAPFSLTGSCHLTSIIPGQAECYISVFIVDNDFITPTPIRRGVIKVNGMIVSDLVNDNLNPSGGIFTGVAGGVAVPCGMKHSVVALVAPVGGSFSQEGSLPKIQCPAAP